MRSSHSPSQHAAHHREHSSYLLYSEPLHSFLPGERALPSRPFSDFRFICKGKDKLKQGGAQPSVHVLGHRFSAKSDRVGDPAQPVFQDHALVGNLQKLKAN